jgi:hypothetical protein
MSGVIRLAYVGGVESSLQPRHMEQRLQVLSDMFLMSKTYTQKRAGLLKALLAAD